MKTVRMKTTEKVLFSVTHLFIFILILILLVFYGQDLSVLQLQMIVIFLFIENCMFSLLGEFFNIYQIFLGTFFVFIFNRIFFDAVGVCDFRIIHLFEKNYMTDQQAKTTLLVLLTFLMAASMAWLVYLPYSDNYVRKSIHFYLHPHYSKITHIIQRAYYCLIFLSIVKSIIIIQQVLLNGYLWIFNGGVQTFKFPFFLRVQSLTEIVFIALLFYNRSEHYVKKNMILYMIYLFIKMFDGQRGQFFVSLLLLLWIYSTYYKRIHIGKVVVIGIFSLIIISFIQWFRGDGYTPFYSVLYGQGISLLVITGTIRYMDAFTNKYSFILGYFIDYFSKLFNSNLKIGQNMERILHGNYLGDHLTYSISPATYLNGNGTGTSIIAEMYEFTSGNLFALFLVSFIFMMLILFLSHYLYKNISCIIVIYFILYRFIYSPRDSVFKCIDMIVLSLPVMLLLKITELKEEELKTRM